MAGLPKEAAQYQDIALETRAGFDLSFALAKILFVSGFISGIAGGCLMVFRKTYGVMFFSVAPAAILAGNCLTGFQSTYPLLENSISIFFLCVASALWGAAIFRGAVNTGGE
jgi:hypothetical protein